MKFDIPIFRLSYDDKFIDEYLRNSREILESGILSEDKWVKNWESEFSKFQKVNHCLSITSGTAGLECLLKYVDVRGKFVAVPSLTFFASATAIEAAGGIPVFVDVNKDDYSICTKDLRRKISEKNISAVMIVHIGGIITDRIYDIVSICKDHNIPLIEDAAHAHGSYIDGVPAGCFGIGGSFSFFPTKVMTTGEGGMIVSNSESVINHCKKYKNFGADPDKKLCESRQGTNYRISEFTGMLGTLETKRASERIQRRNLLANRYIENLKDTKFKFVGQKRGYCSFYKIILDTSEVGPNNLIRKHCKNNNIVLTGEVYSSPVHCQPYFSKQKHELPVTEHISRYHICPPLYPELSIDEVDYVCKILKGFTA